MIQGSVRSAQTLLSWTMVHCWSLAALLRLALLIRLSDAALMAESAASPVDDCSVKVFLRGGNTYFGLRGHGGGYFGYTGLNLETYAERSPSWRTDMSDAMTALAGCRALPHGGGRYWDVAVEVLPNASHPLAFFIREALQGLQSLEFAVCAPVACNAADLRSLVVPGVFLPMTFGWGAAAVMAAGSGAESGRAALRSIVDPGIHRSLKISAVEMGAWSELDLSWAILGFGGGGTSSVAWNLHQHPDLELLYEPDTEGINYEDYFFLYSRTRHLPTRHEVRRFNRARKTQGDPSRKTLRGVKRGNYAYSDAALARLGLIPNLRAILMLRDPAKQAWNGYLDCIRRALEAADAKSLAAVDEVTLEACGKQDVMASYVESLLVRFNATLRVFGRHRVFFAPAEEMGAGRPFWNRLTAFLGARPFPSETKFEHVNKDFNFYGSKLKSSAVLALVVANLSLCQTLQRLVARARALVLARRSDFLAAFRLLPQSPYFESNLPAWLREGAPEELQVRCGHVPATDSVR
eukprot:TRINITY_DN8904_c0_g3_i1.p1 TRINITY_DN8904_c0_g3~~TRINITY_DN8904_c0_g3_i1.p1  ORF type:complete len:522 (-),score=112.64 TRINITY_DN8904_c0_g3_i1:94-1659(-)